MCWRSKRTFRSKWPKRAHDNDILNFQPSEWESSTTHTTTHLDLLRGGTKINIDCLFKFNTAFTCTVVKIIQQYESIFIFKSYCTVVLWVEQLLAIGNATSHLKWLEHWSLSNFMTAMPRVVFWPLLKIDDLWIHFIESLVHPKRKLEESINHKHPKLIRVYGPYLLTSSWNQTELG